MATPQAEGAPAYEGSGATMMNGGASDFGSQEVSLQANGDAKEKHRNTENLRNEFPHAFNDPESYFCTEHYCLVMVGLPAMGKTFVAHRLAKWLKFFHDVNVKVFNLGNERRQSVGVKIPHSFFDPANKENKERYCKIQRSFVRRIKTDFLVKDQVPRIAIYDACNHTKETRDWIINEMGTKIKVIFIECIVNDPAVIKGYLGEVWKTMPDYDGVDGKEASLDYKNRIKHFRQAYEPMKDPNLRYFPGQIVNFLMNLHTVPRPIYLSRHGQSQYNALGKIGGDSSLTKEGIKYAQKLARFCEKHILTGGGSETKDKDKCDNPKHARLYTSTLRRTNETVQFISHRVQEDGWVTLRQRQWRALDEIYAGVFDGMTYKEIQEKCPTAYVNRKRNKLTYRYPRGESYLDVIKRVEQVMLHMQRHKDPVVIVAHQAILRVIYTYFMGLPRETATIKPIPLNTVIKLTPYAYHTKEEKFVLHQMGKSGGHGDFAPSH
ncbi:hypothetical protein AAMO2058_000984900 [Amorphochlora amoebiformis]